MKKGTGWIIAAVILAFVGCLSSSKRSTRFGTEGLRYHRVPSYAFPAAENGSHYGEISRQTGRPKTVRVRGYYRKSGTYVRSHYRSRPRR